MRTASRSDRLSILVAGMLAGTPFHGGATWAVLQYVLGFRRLGHDVTFVEEVAGPMAGSGTAAYFQEVVRRFGLEGSAALLRSGSQETVGMSLERLRSAAVRADLLVNLSGVLRDPQLTESVPIRAYVDLDPGFTQFWAEEGIDMNLGAHDRFATVGLEVGVPSCPIPTLGLDWIRTPPPVVLEHWPASQDRPADAFTTVGNWRSYGSIVREGVRYGQKAHSMRDLLDLPGRSGQRFDLAMAVDNGDRADLDRLHRHGWSLVDPSGTAGTPDRYRAFVAGSLAELGVAKSGYVAARSGWFSERSACYLASGRPVVAQDTGFSRHFPVGRGLIAFDDVDDAVAAVEAVRSDYASHASYARFIAEEHFDSDRVLATLLRELSCN